MDAPNLEPCWLKGGREGYYLQEPWAYGWNEGRIDLELRLPAGFATDGASVPRILWTCTGITPDGLIRSAALVHDALYRFRGLVPDGWLWERDSGRLLYTDEPPGNWRPAAPMRRFFLRSEIDALFSRIMREAGVGKIKRRLAYLGVRLGGKIEWMRKPRMLEVDR